MVNENAMKIVANMDNGGMKPIDTIQTLLRAKPSTPAVDLVDSVRQAGRLESSLPGWIRETRACQDPLLRARLWAVVGTAVETVKPAPALHRALQKAAPEGIRRAAFDAVGESVSAADDLPDQPRKACIQHDQVVWVTTPVRIDLSGGWTDTPPISLEGGGCVVNAAITLNNQYPVQVMAKLNSAGSIRLTSIDLSERIEITSTAMLHADIDPRHWAALPKAALILAGIGPSRKSDSLGRWLKTLGGGIDLTLFSALPKGSGMGTSSILGAAVLACLARVRGEEPQLERLFFLTSTLEQRMKTGGGWQDQIGGMVPGVKRILTAPGPDQGPKLRPILLEHAWRNRMLLYFTGQKRMARGILENVVWRYLMRDPKTLDVLSRLRRAAMDMTRALEGVDFDCFARGIEDYWSLKKQIDPGSTNPGIEDILERTKRWTAASLLPGAGGGGFILFVARDERKALSIRRELEARPASPQARFFDFDVDPYGLRVTVL
jgi:galactokinase/mevalonate kinase-like predicted kinase